MLVSELINSAGRKIGFTPTTAEAANFLAALQSMLRSWAAEKISVFASVREDFTLVSGTALYTWGVGGTINTLRPNQVLSVSVTDSGGTTHPMMVTASGTYNALTVKTTTGRPELLYPQYTFPFINVRLYPVPDAAETLNLESLKPFTEASSFSALGDTIQMPLAYEEAIIYNLAIRVAPEFGKEIPSTVAVIADESYSRIKTLNTANFIESVDIVIPAGSHGGYNINTG